LDSYEGRQGTGWDSSVWYFEVSELQRPTDTFRIFTDADCRTWRSYDCRGFDVYVNMVLEDVTEYDRDPESGNAIQETAKLDQILLNGNTIAALVPGGKP
jgi:hypothetical protein